ncbi:hypothetical protein LINGRAHAP2_LOCUS12262 [Linum grandiflorum]
MEGLRSYSVQRSYCYDDGAGRGQAAREAKVRKKQGSTAKTTKFDPETAKRKRVASYNAYAMEGKVKGSLRKSFRWVKDACNLAVHGWK